MYVCITLIERTRHVEEVEQFGGEVAAGQVGAVVPRAEAVEAPAEDEAARALPRGRHRAPVARVPPCALHVEHGRQVPRDHLRRLLAPFGAQVVRRLPELTQRAQVDACAQRTQQSVYDHEL